MFPVFREFSIQIYPIQTKVPEFFSRYSGSLLKTPKCYIFSFRTKKPVAKTWDEHPHPQTTVFFWNEGIRVVGGLWGILGVEWGWDSLCKFPDPWPSSTHQQRISVSFRTACFGGEEKVTIRREEHLGWHFGIDVVDKHPVFGIIRHHFFPSIWMRGFSPLTNWEKKKIMRVGNLGIFPFKKWPSTILGIFGINGSGGFDHWFGRLRTHRLVDVRAMFFNGEFMEIEGHSPQFFLGK